MIPYSRQRLEEDDIEAVVSVLRSAWLTTGPKVAEFEQLFAAHAGTKHAVAVNNGTAALHAALHAQGIGPGDEVIVPANTFVATANALLYLGGKPIFADIDPRTFLMDPKKVEEKITPQTKGIIPVDFAGLPCDYEAFRSIADRHGLFLHADACHALGATFGNRPVGSLADSSSFSFHPVKPITTGEGGMITTDDAALAAKMRTFRNHGISIDFKQREQSGTWEYDMECLGFNYRLSDLQCALGITQLSKLSKFVSSRRQVAHRYRELLSDVEWLELPHVPTNRTHAYHLFPCQIREHAPVSQRDAFTRLRASGVGAHVMYRPVYLHSYYRDNLGYKAGICPNAETAYKQILTLPISAAMTEKQIETVVEQVKALSFAKL